MQCVFCDISNDRIIFQNGDFMVLRDNFPVTHLHTLIVSKSHQLTLDTMSDIQFIDLHKIINGVKKDILKTENLVSGFNIGINEGVDAGQSIMHFHLHIIPRRKGDTENPRGGVRGVIPEKQNY